MKRKQTATLASGLFAFVLLALTSCSKQSNMGLNPPVPPAPVGSFRNLEVNGCVKVILTSDTVNNLDSTFGGVVNRHYKGQTLSLSGSGTAKISIKQLDVLTVTGWSDISCADTLRMDSMLVESHGSSSKINLKLVLKKSMGIVMTGNNDNYVLSGSSPKFNVNIKGSPEVHSYSFLTNDCSVIMNGSGNCEIYSSKSLSVNL